MAVQVSIKTREVDDMACKRMKEKKLEERWKWMISE